MQFELLCVVSETIPRLGDPITKVTIRQCVESIINPSLVLDSRCLQSLKYKAGPYPPLDEENGQAIESLDLPFLLRLSHLLRAPDEHREEIRNSYARLKVEWPFTRRRYRYMSGICKISGIDRSCLALAEAQLGTAHTVILGAALVLNACLLAMDPTNANLERDALEMGSEAIEVSRKLLIGLPKGVWLAPVALFASWIATDDPDITCSFFSIIKECHQYWAEPAYMELAKTLKKRILQLRVNAVMEQGRRGFRDFGLCIACGAGNQGQDAHHSLSLGIDSHGETMTGQLTPLSDVHHWGPII
ncbi:hypothetical protein CRV24_008550 [Beauveria bassiana]|nr:hypothetical protein CRV24_008550 [Beauveria bassiana]KAH8716636.1 hypothetical protein HC256_005396 [Beauveria bassiana]